MGIKNFITAAAVCGMFCFSACSDDNENNVGAPDPIDEGEPTTMTIAITQPKTYAADANATTDEVKFNWADVFIYSGNSLSTHATLQASEFNPAGVNKWESDRKIATKTGNKDVYVAVNMPADMVELIKSSGTVSGIYAVQTASVAKLTTTSGFTMFSRDGVNRTFVSEDDADVDTKNSVEVQVDRLTAKVTVEEGEDLDYQVAGGIIADLSFAMRNVNNLIYAKQKWEGTNVIDPNYLVSEWKQANFINEPVANYVAVDKAGIKKIEDYTNKYVLENTSASWYERETTYASVRALFVPEDFTNADGTEKTGSTYSSGDDFWVVYAGTDGIRYFDTEADAEKFATDNSYAAPVLYEDGYCYYNIFLNPRGKYQTLRNNYYKATINSILGIGNPKPGDGGEGEIPVEEPTRIQVVIDIMPWNVVEDSYDLSM